MQSIRGIYTGKEIKALEDIHVRPNVRVIITFLDEAFDNAEQEFGAETSHNVPSQSLTQEFMKKCGGWEDTRSADDIIAEIYAKPRSLLAPGEEKTML